MATVNTAFGVLPSPKTQTLGVNAQQRQRQQRPPQQQGQGQPQTPASQTATPTFAQMQQQGQARPAPQPAMMQQGAQPAQQPQMLQALGAQLAQPQAAPPVQPVQPAALAQPMAQPMAQQIPMESPVSLPPEQAVQAQAAPMPAAMPQQQAAYQLGQSFQQGAGSQELASRLMAQLTSLGQAGSTYNDPAFAAQREAAVANLQAERQASETALQEEMARRGLSASSIASGRLGDIAGQFGRAQATLEADLLKEAMTKDQQREQFLTQQLGQALGTMGEQELNAFRANVESVRSAADVDARAAELQQEARLRGRELDLTAARDLASQEQARGQLALGYAEMGSRERMSAADIGSREKMQQAGFTFEAGQSALERSLREKMQTTELSAQEKRQLADIAAQRELQTGRQTFEASQSALERGLREKMQTTELTAQEKRQLAEIEANKAAQADRQKFEAEQRKQTEAWQAEQSKLDRDLRQLLSKQDIDAAQARFEQTYKLDMERFGFEKGQASNQFLSQLAATLAPMDPRKRDEFLRTLGLDPKKLGLNQPAPGIGDIANPGQS